MVRSLHISPLRIFISAFIVLAAMAFPDRARALAPDTYTSSSVLSQGRWVKISVTESGLHNIPAATLRSWGFSDPAKVRVYGYGGQRITNTLSQDSYVDDLPFVPSELTSSGLVFYAAGPESWENSTGTYYHGELNIYSSYGYYFLTESDESAPEFPLTGIQGASRPQTTGMARIHHELEQTLVAESGPIMGGEDFRSTRTRSFSFKTPGRRDNNVWVECQFIHRHIGASAKVAMAVDGNEGDNSTSFDVTSTSDSHYVHASVGSGRSTFTTKATDGFQLSITYNPTRTVYLAHLDYISVNYVRNLEMDALGCVNFWSSATQLGFTGDSDVRIWDVTDPWAVEKVNAAVADGQHTWSISGQNIRSYVAWRPGASLPTPSLVGRISNQNLHAEKGAVDMVIFAPSQLTEQATRIANLHVAEDSLKVLVVNPEEVYNEFSSGMGDVAGLRKYLKMLYDRGNASGYPLRYALLMGRPSLDYRGILESTRSNAYITMPNWIVTTPRLALNDNAGYCTDDFMVMLEDNSGNDMGRDRLSIAVGRIPATSVEDATAVVDKLYQYVQKSKAGLWKNRFLLVADDEDTGTHLFQMESFVNNLMKIEGQQHTINKVYVDAYELISGICPDARKDMFTTLNEGTTWWIFSGHANDHSWTGEGILTYHDLNENIYFRNVPFVIAATCDFMRWDAPKISGGELLFNERYGGAIGMVSAARPVYIPNNGYFMRALGRHIIERDDEGEFITAGEMLRRTKNDIRIDDKSTTISSDDNRLRYSFIGDPAMRLTSPGNTIELLSINDRPVNADDQITIGALSTVTLKGRILKSNGSFFSDFNGLITLELYDALESVTTLAHGGDVGKVDVFDTMGSKLYAGAAHVENGEFTVTFTMPANIADNFRPATLSMFASADNSAAEAIGVNRDFYVAGYNEPQEADTVAPVIESFVLNHTDFKNGEKVSDSPLVIATVSDNVGINLSAAGIGYQLSLKLDDKTSYSDLASFYTPRADGAPGGVINYRLENLAEGAHQLRMRVFDTSGNMSQQEIEFYVSNDVAPRIFDVFTDANPASTMANFYVRHDHTDNLVEVGIEVFNLLGHKIWSSSQKGLSDSDLSAPVTWDLCDMNGRRVNRGIYLYRATITTDNANYQTASRRIAVTR